MVAGGVKWGTWVCGSRNAGHMNIPAVESAFGGSENRRPRKLLLEWENNT